MTTQTSFIPNPFHLLAAQIAVRAKEITDALLDEDGEVVAELERDDQPENSLASALVPAAAAFVAAGAGALLARQLIKYRRGRRPPLSAPALTAQLAREKRSVALTYKGRVWTGRLEAFGSNNIANPLLGFEPESRHIITSLRSDQPDPEYVLFRASDAVAATVSAASDKPNAIVTIEDSLLVYHPSSLADRQRKDEAISARKTLRWAAKKGLGCDLEVVEAASGKMKTEMYSGKLTGIIGDKVYMIIPDNEENSSSCIENGSRLIFSAGDIIAADLTFGSEQLSDGDGPPYLFLTINGENVTVSRRMAQPPLRPAASVDDILAGADDAAPQEEAVSKE